LQELWPRLSHRLTALQSRHGVGAIVTPEPVVEPPHAANVARARHDTLVLVQKHIPSELDDSLTSPDSHCARMRAHAAERRAHARREHVVVVHARPERAARACSQAAGAVAEVAPHGRRAYRRLVLEVMDDVAEVSAPSPAARAVEEVGRCCPAGRSRRERRCRGHGPSLLSRTKT
jgi:hypothetical protein